jgi:hypothetical protein
MSVRALTDGARIVAAISALAFSLFVIMGCAFASDAGTLTSTLMAPAGIAAVNILATTRT